MALIKCPECGREKVSDNAEACPNCGYGIKAHFEKIRKEEERLKEEEMRKKEYERLAEERERELQTEIAAMPAPRKPFPWIILLGIFFAAGAIVFFCTDSFFLGIFEGFISFILIAGGYSDYKDKKRIYEISLHDMERAKREALELKKENQAIADEQNVKIMNAINPFSKTTNGLKCPMCGKNAGKKITTASRAASVATVGLASKKIGKQYKCSNCGHMW